MSKLLLFEDPLNGSSETMPIADSGPVVMRASS